MSTETPQSRLLEALIFDLDGVLIASDALHERAKRDALSEAGIMGPESLLANDIGRSDKAICQIAAAYGSSERRSAEILNRKHRVYESPEPALCPVSGAVEFVHWTKSRYRLALTISATRRNPETTLKPHQIECMFEVAVDGTSFWQPKPSTEVFQIALERLGLAPTACLVILNRMIAGLDLCLRASALRNLAPRERGFPQTVSSEESEHRVERSTEGTICR